VNTVTLVNQCLNTVLTSLSQTQNEAAHPTSDPMGTMVFSLGIKQPGREAN